METSAERDGAELSLMHFAIFLARPLCTARGSPLLP
jgi:hypothetical protein